MKKITILGAGVAGLSAAINLAKAGYPVEVFERSKDVGLKFGGDLQGLENWSEKKDVIEDIRDMNIDINFETTPLSHVDISNGQPDNLYQYKFSRPIYYLVTRGRMNNSLDHRLKEQAYSQGITIHFKSSLSPDNAQIIATGPNYQELWSADRGIVFKTSMQDTFAGVINNQVAYKGYSYLLVTKGYGCLCTCIFDQLSRLNECFERTKKTFSKLYKLDIQNPKSVGGVGSFSSKNIFEKNGKLYIGEAAGIQDFLLGFGIRNAITSGYLAAQSIINNTSYKLIAHQKFSQRFKAGIVNRYLWEKFTSHGLPYQMGRLRDVSNPFKFLHSIYNFNFWQIIIYPLALKYIRKKYHQLKI